MSISLDPIVSTNTFGVWKDRTNEIVTALEDVVTIGGATANRDGDVTIRGDITSLANVNVDVIKPYDLAENLVTIAGKLVTDDVVRINNGGDGQVSITFSDDNVTTWTMATNTDHGEFDIGRAEKYLKLDYDNGLITGANMIISRNILPSSDSIDEGSVNLYYSSERVRSEVGVEANSSLTYDEDTGLFGFTMPHIPTYGVTSSKALKRTAVADGSNTNYTFGVNFDDSTIKTNSKNELYVVQSAVRDMLSSGTGVSYSSGKFSIGQSVGTSDNVTFGDISGDAITGDSIGATGAVSGASLTVSGAISGGSVAGSMIATQAQAEAGTNTTKLMTPERVLQAIQAWSEPKWAGATTLENVKNTYSNAPVGTRVAFWEERNYTRPSNSNGGNVSISDRYYRVVKKTGSTTWDTVGG
jgi:hypothetical protein